MHWDKALTNYSVQISNPGNLIVGLLVSRPIIQPKKSILCEIEKKHNFT